jgi:hypothetical protein
MLKIAHRINTPQALAATPQEYGVEMDLHAYGDRLVVHHDAFTDAVDFDEWLDEYHHAFVILNVKEEGIETRVREMTLARGIENFFMLDLSFPALMKMIRADESRVALRVSEYEAAAGPVAMAGLAEWIWLDVFHGFPVSREDYHKMRDANYKFCLVSPELHGRDKNEIAEMQATMKEMGVSVEAVCTKFPELW